MSDLPLLPTTVVGSHAKPGWWHQCKDLTEDGQWGPYDLEELLDDAADIAILDQERAGVDIITDGEARRLDGYVDGYYNIIEGIRALPVARQAGPWGYDQQTRYEAIGKIKAPEGLGIVEEFQYLIAHTQRSTKATGSPKVRPFQAAHRWLVTMRYPPTDAPRQTEPHQERAALYVATHQLTRRVVTLSLAAKLALPMILANTNRHQTLYR